MREPSLQNKMKILLDFSNAANDKYLFDYSFNDCLIKPLAKFNTDITVILNDELYKKFEAQNLLKKYNCRFLSISNEKYTKLGYTVEEIYKYLFSQNNSQKYELVVTNVYKEILNDYTPDVTITFETGNCVLKKLYPNSLNLVFNGGAWKSVPPDFSICFDPINSFSFSSLVKYSQEIRNFKINEKQNNKVEKFKKLFRNRIINTNIAKKEILHYKRKYKKLILLPLQLQCFNFEMEGGFKSQKEYFEYVMDRVPKNIGVIVTGHWVNINEIKDMILKNSDKYSNAIIINEIFNHPPQTSLYVLPYVDAMVNVSSSLVLKALYCGVKIISLGKRYNEWCKDASTFENIEELLSGNCCDKNNILYWYATHYDINTTTVKRGDWLYNYLKKYLNKKDNINFNYFEEIISIDEVIKYYSKVKFDKKFKKKHEFFSITKTDTHNVINISGLKIKIKRGKQ